MASETTPLLHSKDLESTREAKKQGYSWQVGFVYVFNIMVGAGLLTLPKAFAEVGWLLGLICLGFCAFISFITVTFVVEALSLANILLRYRKSEERKAEETEKSCSMNMKNGTFEPREELVHLKEWTKYDASCPPEYPSQSISPRKKEKINFILNKEIVTECHGMNVSMELGEMSKLFFNRVGVILYYISICLYIYGTTTVYVVVISKSLTTIVCDDVNCFRRNMTSQCGRFTDVTPSYMYRYTLVLLIACVCPFAYFDVKKTKLLQMLTTGYRWFSMLSMVVLTFVKIGQGNDIPAHLNVFVLNKIPRFFGMALYAFMCQHSIPAVTSPVTNQSRVLFLLGLDYLSTFTFYTVTLMSSVFAFPEESIQDIYTLNFTQPIFFKYLLQLFPVFTLSTTIPVFAIVLRNNLRNLFSSASENKLERFVFSSVAILPPLVIAFLTHDVSGLVRYTGTYAGTAIQYVFPTLLVCFGRRTLANICGEEIVNANPRSSPFGSPFWIGFILIWYVVSVLVVTYDNIGGMKFD